MDLLEISNVFRELMNQDLCCLHRCCSHWSYSIFCLLAIERANYVVMLNHRPYQWEEWNWRKHVGLLRCGRWCLLQRYQSRQFEICFVFWCLDSNYCMVIDPFCTLFNFENFVSRQKCHQQIFPWSSFLHHWTSSYNCLPLQSQIGFTICCLYGHSASFRSIHYYYFGWQIEDGCWSLEVSFHFGKMSVLSCCYVGVKWLILEFLHLDLLYSLL